MLRVRQGTAGGSSGLSCGASRTSGQLCLLMGASH